MQDPTEGWIPHTDETEALIPAPPLEVDLEPLARRLVHASLDAGPGVICMPDTDDLVEMPMREHARAISTAPNIVGQAVNESIFGESADDFDGVPEEDIEKSYNAISRFDRCKGKPGQKGFCGGSAEYIPRGGSYYKCVGEWCTAALVAPGECESCDQPLRRVKVNRGTIVCLDKACGHISEYTGAGAEKRGLASPPKQASSAATEAKLIRAFGHEIEHHLDSMLASTKWGGRTRVMLFIHSGEPARTARMRKRSKLEPSADYIRVEAAHWATAEGIKQQYDTGWTQHKVERGVAEVAAELRKRLRLDDTTAYREMAARFRRNGSQRLLDALADKLAADKRLRDLGIELGLTQ